MISDCIRSIGVICDFFFGLVDWAMGPAACSISPAFCMNLSRTSSLRIVSFKNFRYSKSLTEFFYPAALIAFGRKPVVFQACYKPTLATEPKPSSRLSLLLPRVLVPRIISRSRIICLVRVTLPRLSSWVLGRLLLSRLLKLEFCCDCWTVCAF